MNKYVIAELIENQRQEIGNLLKSIDKSGYLKLEGTLYCKMEHGEFRYYIREKAQDVPRYQRADKNTEKLISALCTKTYAKKLHNAAEKELLQLTRCLKIIKAKEGTRFDDADIDAVYDNLPEGIRSQVRPSQFTDDGFAEKWQAEKYQKRWEGKGTFYETPRGEKVRSKSEWMIACMLDKASVPYRYEELIGLNEYLGGNLHPDFTVLNKRTRKEYYWEHFGRMDDPKYVEESFMPKIRDYYACGFLPGEKLLMTFESKEHPFDTTQVERLIEEYLK